MALPECLNAIEDDAIFVGNTSITIFRDTDKVAIWHTRYDSYLIDKFHTYDLDKKEIDSVLGEGAFDALMKGNVETERHSSIGYSIVLTFKDQIT